MAPVTYHSLTNNGAVEGRAGTRAVMNPATGVSFAEVSLLTSAAGPTRGGSGVLAGPGRSANVRY